MCLWQRIIVYLLRIYHCRVVSSSAYGQPHIIYWCQQVYDRHAICELLYGRQALIGETWLRMICIASIVMIITHRVLKLHKASTRFRETWWIQEHAAKFNVFWSMSFILCLFFEHSSNHSQLGLITCFYSVTESAKNEEAANISKKCKATKLWNHPRVCQWQCQNLVFPPPTSHASTGVNRWTSATSEAASTCCCTVQPADPWEEQRPWQVPWNQLGWNSSDCSGETTSCLGIQRH